jgi:hypothetical protein
MLLFGPEHNRQGVQSVEMTARRWRRMGTQGWRRLQFPSLLLTRSYWGLIHALNWWDVIDEHFPWWCTLFDDLERLQAGRAVVNLKVERRISTPLREGVRYLWLPVRCFPDVKQIQQVWSGSSSNPRWTPQVVIGYRCRPFGDAVSLLVYLCRGMRVPQVLRH